MGHQPFYEPVLRLQVGGQASCSTGQAAESLDWESHMLSTRLLVFFHLWYVDHWWYVRLLYVLCGIVFLKYTVVQ